MAECFRPQRKLLLHQFLQGLNLQAPPEEAIADTEAVVDYYATQISMVKHLYYLPSTPS
jgi:hypothetical protein